VVDVASKRGLPKKEKKGRRKKNARHAESKCSRSSLNDRPGLKGGKRMGPGGQRRKYQKTCHAKLAAVKSEKEMALQNKKKKSRKDYPVK